jgi:hypothetical protein
MYHPHVVLRRRMVTSPTLVALVTPSSGVTPSPPGVKVPVPPRLSLSAVVRYLL